MADEERETCAHPGCNCPKPQDSDYCSASCAGAEDIAEVICDCGHPGCM
ncbi:MAG TPA: hypothetical protein VGX92_02960 [Pyrinomonadaceae bacterium]|nr:hypothetical protein [Pyrinomonadaceae bacterium]